tara:strand:+ start:2176 stop:2712 length:537 start_codon:yes stop_codon:yes gene_type:complete
MLQKCNIIKTAGVFFKEPTKQHYLIEISRKTNLAHTSTKQHLKQLIKLGIIDETKEKRGKRVFPIYKANFNEETYRKYKRYYNIYSLEQSGLIEHLVRKLTPHCLVLFGSYQRGEDIEDSDIDLFIERGEKNLDLKKFEKILNREIQIHFKKSFKDYHKGLKINIANGIVLQGHLDAF